jgi:hypothetical protein
VDTGKIGIDNDSSVYSVTSSASSPSNLLDAVNISADTAEAGLDCVWIADEAKVSCQTGDAFLDTTLKTDAGFVDFVETDDIDAPIPYPNTIAARRVGRVLVYQGQPTGDTVLWTDGELYLSDGTVFQSRTSKDDANTQALSHAESLLVCHWFNDETAWGCVDAKDTGSGADLRRNPEWVDTIETPKWAWERAGVSLVSYAGFSNTYDGEILKFVSFGSDTGQHEVVGFNRLALAPVGNVPAGSIASSGKLAFVHTLDLPAELGTTLSFYTASDRVTPAVVADRAGGVIEGTGSFGAYYGGDQVNKLDAGSVVSVVSQADADAQALLQVQSAVVCEWGNDAEGLECANRYLAEFSDSIREDITDTPYTVDGVTRSIAEYLKTLPGFVGSNTSEKQSNADGGIPVKADGSASVDPLSTWAYVKGDAVGTTAMHKYVAAWIDDKSYTTDKAQVRLWRMRPSVSSTSGTGENVFRSSTSKQDANEQARAFAFLSLDCIWCNHPVTVGCLNAINETKGIDGGSSCDENPTVAQATAGSIATLPKAQTSIDDLCTYGNTEVRMSCDGNYSDGEYSDAPTTLLSSAADAGSSEDHRLWLSASSYPRPDNATLEATALSELAFLKPGANAGWRGGGKHVVVPANTFTSDVDVATATALAKAYAESQLRCLYGNEGKTYTCSDFGLTAPPSITDADGTAAFIGGCDDDVSDVLVTRDTFQATTKSQADVLARSYAFTSIQCIYYSPAVTVSCSKLIAESGASTTDAKISFSLAANAYQGFTCDEAKALAQTAAVAGFSALKETLPWDCDGKLKEPYKLSVRIKGATSSFNVCDRLALTDTCASIVNEIADVWNDEMGNASGYRKDERGKSYYDPGVKSVCGDTVTIGETGRSRTYMKTAPECAGAPLKPDAHKPPTDDDIALSCPTVVHVAQAGNASGYWMQIADECGTESEEFCPHAFKTYIRKDPNDDNKWQVYVCPGTVNGVLALGDGVGGWVDSADLLGTSGTVGLNVTFGTSGLDNTAQVVTDVTASEYTVKERCASGAPPGLATIAIAELVEADGDYTVTQIVTGPILVSPVLTNVDNVDLTMTWCWSMW